MRSIVPAVVASLLLATLAACGGGETGGGGGTTPARSYRMGFSAFPSRLDATVLLNGIDQWSQRAELAIIHEELPWTELLAGAAPAAIIDAHYGSLVALYRSKGLRLVYIGDLTDGLSRGQDAPQLRALGRSITEPAVQALYRSFVVAVDRKLKPEYIGLAAETNFTRIAAPAPLYAAVVATTNAAAADLRAGGTTATLFVSVQVETAWGLLQGTSYVGIDADRRDFPFMQMLGLSSYPFLTYADPDNIPVDYYRRVVSSAALPAMVVEGGWASASVANIVSSAATQARYITRHGELLDSVSAIGVIQLDFADVDLAALPPPLPAELALFASIGLVDTNYRPKPALAVWDALHARPLAAR